MAEEVKKEPEKPAEWVKDDLDLAAHKKIVTELFKKYNISQEDQIQLNGSMCTICTIKLKRMLFQTKVVKKVMESLKKEK